MSITTRFPTIIQSIKLRAFQFIKSLPKKQIVPISIAWQSMFMDMKYKYFIFVIPAAMQNASSGKPGIMNDKGSRILLFVSSKSWILLNSFFPMILFINFSPNLSPRKNSIVEEQNTAIKQEKKAVFAPNIKIPKTINAGFITGTKHKQTRNRIWIHIKTKTPQFPVLDIIVFRVSKSVIPKALNIKNRATEMPMQPSRIRVNFSHLFILYCMIN